MGGDKLWNKIHTKHLLEDGQRFTTRQTRQLPRMTSKEIDPVLLVDLDNAMKVLQEKIANGANLNTVLTSKNDTILRFAISKLKNTELVKFLIDAGADVNFQHAEWSPLSLAIYDEYFDMITTLVSKGADVNQVLANAHTHLTYALELNCDLKILEYLICNGANVNQVGFNGKTPLIHAIEKRNYPAIELLIKNGADMYKACSDTTPYKLTQQSTVKKLQDFSLKYRTLTDAINEGTLQEVGEILSKGTGVDQIARNGLTPLCIAIIAKKRDIVEYLIKEGANVCKILPDDRTPLLIAVESKNLDLVKLLIENGAHHTIQSVFMEAVTLADLETVKFLHDNKAIVNVTYKNGHTPLTKSVEINNLELVKELISYGADVHMANHDGKHPLTIALDEGRPDIAEYLIEQGAKLPGNILEKCPFLLKFIEKHNIPLVKKLVELGVQLNINLSSGYTPLTKAVDMENYTLVQYLVENGAKPNLIDGNNKLPLELACRNCNIQIAKFLIDSKAEIETIRSEVVDFANKSDDFGIYLQGKFEYHVLQKWNGIGGFGSEAVAEPLEIGEEPDAVTDEEYN